MSCFGNNEEIVIIVNNKFENDKGYDGSHYR